MTGARYINAVSLRISGPDVRGRTKRTTQVNNFTGPCYNKSTVPSYAVVILPEKKRGKNIPGFRGAPG